MKDSLVDIKMNKKKYKPLTYWRPEKFKMKCNRSKVKRWVQSNGLNRNERKRIAQEMKDNSHTDVRLKMIKNKNKNKPSHCERS